MQVLLTCCTNKHVLFPSKVMHKTKKKKSSYLYNLKVKIKKTIGWTNVSGLTSVICSKRDSLVMFWSYPKSVILILIHVFVWTRCDITTKLLIYSSLVLKRLMCFFDLRVLATINKRFSFNLWQANRLRSIWVFLWSCSSLLLKWWAGTFCTICRGDWPTGKSTK